MGWFDKAKEKAREVLDAVKHGAHQVIEDVKDESQMHMFLSAFKRQVEYDLERTRSKMPQDSILAAENIIRGLDSLLDADSINPHRKIPNQQYELLCDACKVIDDNIVPMTAAPGFLNRCVASFNNAMEKWFGLKDFIPFYKVEKTAIVESTRDLSVTKFKDELYKIKGQADEVAFENTIEAVKEEVQNFIKPSK